MSSSWAFSRSASARPSSARAAGLVHDLLDLPVGGLAEHPDVAVHPPGDAHERAPAEDGADRHEEAEAGTEVRAEQQVHGAHQHDDADEHREEAADLRVPGDAGEQVDSISSSPSSPVGGRPAAGSSSSHEPAQPGGDRARSRLAEAGLVLGDRADHLVGEHAVAGEVVVEVVRVVGVVAEAGHAAGALAPLAVEQPVPGALVEEVHQVLDGEELARDHTAGERPAEGAGAVGEAGVVAEVGVLGLDGAVLERRALRVAAAAGVRAAGEAVLQAEVEQRLAGGGVVPVDVGVLGEAQLARAPRPRPRPWPRRR